MPYTIWSRGRLLGETELEFPQVFSNHRGGWFRPSAAGDALMSVLTGTGPALRAVGKLLRSPSRQAAALAPGDGERGLSSDIRSTTEYADLVSTVDQLEAMQLQVRDPGGAILEIDHVGIEDMEFKLSLVPKRRRRRLAREIDREPWESEPAPTPRYQVQVFFRGEQTAIDTVRPGAG